MAAARKPAAAATDDGAGESLAVAPPAAGGAPEPPEPGPAPALVWYQAPGHVIGFTLPLGPVIQGQVDSGYLTPADPPE